MQKRVWSVCLTGIPGRRRRTRTLALPSSSVSSDQLVLCLDWGKEPWAGWSPRSLTKVARGASCVVDKSEVSCPSREALRIGPDPAQFILYLKGKSDGS